MPKKVVEEEYEEKEVHNKLPSTLATEHIIKPGEDKLSEVSYLSYGLVHSLTMLQAYENHLVGIVAQIKERRHWFLDRYIKRMKMVGKWTQELENSAREQVEDDIESLDEVDLTKLFIHQLRISVYQHSRGKDGKFVESLTILADTDMQTRQAAEDDSFKSPIRNQ